MNTMKFMKKTVCSSLVLASFLQTVAPLCAMNADELDARGAAVRGVRVQDLTEGQRNLIALAALPGKNLKNIFQAFRMIAENLPLPEIDPTQTTIGIFNLSDVKQLYLSCEEDFKKVNEASFLASFGALVLVPEEKDVLRQKGLALFRQAQSASYHVVSALKQVIDEIPEKQGELSSFLVRQFKNFFGYLQNFERHLLSPEFGTFIKDCPLTLEEARIFIISGYSPSEQDKKFAESFKDSWKKNLLPKQLVQNILSNEGKLLCGMSPLLVLSSAEIEAQRAAEEARRLEEATAQRAAAEAQRRAAEVEAQRRAAEEAQRRAAAETQRQQAAAVQGMRQVLPSIAWSNIPDEQKEVLFRVGDTVLGMLKTSGRLQQGLDPVHGFRVSEDLQDPSELFMIGEEGVKQIAVNLRAAPQLKPKADVLVDQINKLNTFVRETVLPTWRSLSAPVKGLRAFFPECGPVEDATFRGAEYQGLIGSLNLLRDHYATLSSQIETSFPLERSGNLDIWALRKRIIPEIILPGEQPLAAAAAAAARTHVAQDLLSREIVRLYEQLNEKVSSSVRNARGNEGIMEVAKAETAPDLLVKIGQILPSLLTHHQIRTSALLNSDGVFNLYESMLKSFPMIRNDTFTKDKIGHIFRNLTQNYDESFRLAHPIRRAVSIEYLTALGLLRDVFTKFNTQPGMDALAAQAFSDLELQSANCGGGALGRSLILYNAIFEFLMKQ